MWQKLGLGDYGQTKTNKYTKFKRFPSRLEVLVPWKALIYLIETYYHVP
jgi:hypothetical protein